MRELFVTAIIGISASVFALAVGGSLFVLTEVLLAP